MLGRQITAVVRATVGVLGGDFDPSPRGDEARERAAPPATLDAFVGQLAAGAERGEVALLHRAPEALEDLVREEAFPLLVAGGPVGGPFTAAVLERLDGDEATGTLVHQDGEPRPLRIAVGALRSRLTARVAGGAGGALRLYVPVSVAPTVGGPQTEALDRPEIGGLVGGESEAGAPGGPEHQGPNPVARLWTFLVRERRDVLLVFGYAAIAGLFSLALPLSVQQIVQLVSGRMLLQPTFLLVAFVLAGTVGVGVLQLMQLTIVEAIQQRVFARVALEFSFRVPRLRYDVALREDLPEVMNRFFETVTIQKSLSKLLLDVSTALLTVLFGLLLLTLYHPYFTAFGAALVLAIGLLFWVTGPRGLATSIMESKYKYKVVHWLEEMARANTAFKFAGRSPLPVERTDALVSGYLKYRNAHFRVLVQQVVGLVAFRTLVVGTLLILGISLVTSNQITLGQFVASEIVIVTVLAGIEKLVASLETVYDALTAVDKLGHVTDMPLEGSGGLALPARGGRGMQLAVRGLTHRYAPGAAPAIDGLTFAARPGERVGITGYEGSGQTTLLRVLSGLLDGSEGAVSVDDLPLRDLDRAGYRAQVGQLLSPADLFDGTVEDNVTVGRPGITPHDALEALGAVGLRDWVDAQPAGLRTHVTNGGRALPTHVVARLLVAQAIVGRPRLVLVDDYYQNVEPDCRADLVACLTDRARPWTLVLVSHDPRMLAACDRVLVLADGRVAREGPFGRLVDESAYVRRLVDGASPVVRTAVGAGA